MRSNAVKLHKNGAYWVARWRDSDGSWKARGLGSIEKVSRRQAEWKLQDLVREHAITPGSRDKGQAPTLEQWAARFAGFRNDLKKGTALMYVNTFDYLRRYFKDATRLDRI
jgi:hypothetical protein